MDNPWLMSFSGLSHALGARLFAGEGKQDGGGFSSVSIDSRMISPGGLFVALRGASLDGHRFVDAAFRAGAAGAMVAFSALEDPGLGLSALAKRWKKTLVAVEDTLRGLQEAAGAYLGGFSNLMRIGITGSSGKTTTKEIAAAIIGQEKSVVMNEGNLNSETGLPLSVFNVRAHHEVGIFEAGMNRQGEIAELAKTLHPHIALITNIGSAHIGIFGARERIAEEKKKIFSEFTGTGTALIPDDDDFRDFLAAGVRGRCVFYGASSLTALGGARDLGLEGSEITWDGAAFRIGQPGRFNLKNALAAAALALEVPVSSESVRRGLESVKPLFGRGEIFRGRTALVRDCYNSNPESAGVALDFCDALEWPGRRVYVIGSMLELGEASREAHAALGRRLAVSRGDMIFLFGKETREAAGALEEAARRADFSGPEKNSGKRNYSFLYTEDMRELSRALDEYIGPGDLVLLKGSRGCALEQLTEILTGNGMPQMAGPTGGGGM